MSGGSSISTDVDGEEGIVAIFCCVSVSERNVGQKISKYKCKSVIVVESVISCTTVFTKQQYKTFHKWSNNTLTLKTTSS